MKRILLFLNMFLFLSVFTLFGQLVDNSLGRSMLRIFPELANGYIDLNGNGRLDELDDVNERIPDSEVKDSVVQVQEVLDFLLEYYPYLPYNKIKSVQTALNTDAEGAIPEIISLSWKTRLEEIVTLRQKMGEDTIRLTPTALREAHAVMSGHLTAMAMSFKKESRNDEQSFIKARDELLGMLEKGYPLPENIPPDERSILINTLIHTTSNPRNPAGALKTSLKTLGTLEAEEAVPYILALLENTTYRHACIQALGEIGNATAVEVLREIAQSDQPEETLNITYRALGRIGGREGTDLLISLAGTAGKNASSDTTAALAEAFTEAAAGGTADRRIAALLNSYAESESPEIRKTAMRGLGYFNNQETAQTLLTKLKTESDEEVKAEIIRALNRMQHPAIIATFAAMLKDEGLSPFLQKEILSALGSNPEGAKAAVQILDFLGNTNASVRAQARKTLFALYRVDQKAIAAVLSRGAAAGKDNGFLKEVTGILSDIADPDTLPVLTTLLQNPSAEIKKNVTWALYRIAPKDNIRLAGDLAKIVAGESEALDARINAVRALGAMNTDNPSLNVWQTLLTTAKMRGDKYTMLRFYAVKALGDLGIKNAEISNTLAQLALRETDKGIQTEALRSLQRLLYPTAEMEQTLTLAFRAGDDQENRVIIVEILGDMKADTAVDSAVKAFADENDGSRKLRILYSLSKVGTTEAFNVMIDFAADRSLEDYILGALEGADPAVLSSLIENRLKTEKREDLVEILERLKNTLEERF
ncbi:MAG: HEAT repeat domain-containing protein [Spirochaetales bacterium]|nr:HEAT repeat domain-containing protein [Spirochaetales bacterium]